MHYKKEPFKVSESRRARALAIIAHPDDETIFLGGTISVFKDWRWSILCVTDCDERYNKARRRELLKAASIYRKNGADIDVGMLGIVKKKGLLPKSNVSNAVKDFVKIKGPFDIVFTHNRVGDYGHNTHLIVSEAVRRLRFRNVRQFYLPYYGIDPKYRSNILRLYEVKLPAKALKAKRIAINMYRSGSQKSNLAHLKRLINHALNAGSEYFIS
ncbi:MAG: PIG-L family deacetylase [Candidatus Omnitrophica bacterium]|nr:PIG-L family deacetylase [Candidatus Omnitrophota bacterium]